MSSSNTINSNKTIILLRKVCPYCDKSYQSNQKAVNHIAAFHQKRVERLVSGNRNFGVYNQTNVQKYERLGYSIVVHYGCFSCKEAFALKEELRKHCDLRHIVASQPETGIITAPNDIIKSGWTFRCPDNDHLVSQNIDITKGFHEFRHFVKTMIDEPRLLTYESHVQHVLALSSILLLKPSRTNNDLHKFIEREVCEGLIEHMLEEYHIESCELDIGTRVATERIIKDCIKNKAADYQDSQRLMALMVPKKDVHNRILFCFRNLMEQLPLEAISQKVDELELITRYVTAAISPLLEDIKKHVMFRWYERKKSTRTQAYFRTSVANDECKSSEMSLLLARPDSTINMIIGTEIGQTVGFGEVKPAAHALNHKLVGKDLVRLALLSKNAIDTYHSKFVLSFLVVGHHITFYLTDGTKNGLYPMIEIAHIQLPMSLKELPLFIAQADQLAIVSTAFWSLCIEQKTEQQSSLVPTLSDNEIAAIMDVHSSRKRKSSTSHHSH